MYSLVALALNTSILVKICILLRLNKVYIFKPVGRASSFVEDSRRWHKTTKCPPLNIVEFSIYLELLACQAYLCYIA